jgi:AcrR family transcriptional regulator
MGETGTKESILDAAEKLFSSQGFAGTSLRAIIKEAGVNSASIHYHFQSREGLIEAVLARRAGPVNRERLELLDRLEAEFPTGRLPVDGVVRAFLEPAIKVVAAGERGRMLGRLMGFAIMESGAELRPIVGRIFKHIIERFIPAFMRAIPDIPPDEVMWRVHFMLGALVFTVNVPRAQDGEGGIELHSLSPEGAFERLIEFVTAGMRAPATQPSGEELQ